MKTEHEYHFMHKLNAKFIIIIVHKMIVNNLLKIEIFRPETNVV